MQLTKNQKIIASVVGVLVLAFVLVLIGVLPGLKSSNPDPKLRAATLNIWTIGDSNRAYESIINDFKTDYPNVKIEIRTFSDQVGYEKNILNALASGQGPDIFMVPNGALARDLQKLAPLPTEKLSVNSFNQLFPQVAGQDFIFQNEIYALPLSIDTLAMYYNRDLFNAAGLPLPPATWEEFQTIIPQLTKFDANRNIVQAGAAIGGSNQSISRATDILLLTMLQKDAPFTNDSLAAFNFYLDFANARQPQYTWNDSFAKDRQAFVSEKTAIIFDYAEARSLISAANINLNFAVAAAPQFRNQSKPAAIAKYWGYSVSRQSKNAQLAWDFIINMTTKETNAENYATSVQKPPALNSLITKLNNDSEWQIFTRQTLIAKSWPQSDPLAVSQIFSKAIINVLAGRANPSQALQQAKSEYNVLISN
ncbi:MAG: extracellular solute-binding protein [bacterium]|nr:extracellular solute-binding protein [bacterium]